MPEPWIYRCYLQPGESRLLIFIDFTHDGVEGVDGGVVVMPAAVREELRRQAPRMGDPLTVERNREGGYACKLSRNPYKQRKDTQ